MKTRGGYGRWREPELQIKQKDLDRKGEAESERITEQSKENIFFIELFIQIFSFY